MTPNLLSPIWQHLSILEVSAGIFFLSGKRQDNPLLLLGQYSDEDLNEEADKTPSHVVGEASSVHQIGEVEEPVGRTSANSEENTEGSSIQPVAQEMKDSSQLTAAWDLGGNEIKEIEIVAPSDSGGEADLAVAISDPSTSQMNVTGDAISGWKTVMDEETHQYYYWNTETGETSWEVPTIVAQGMASEQKVEPVMDEKESTPTPVHMNVTDDEKFRHVDQFSGFDGQVETKNKGEEHEVLQTQQDGCGSPNTTHFENRDESAIIAGGHHEAEIADSTRLVNYAEILLQRLKNLERSNIGLQEQDCISKYTMEIEIRLSDCKALLVFGSSLLPFWIHSEEKLRRLECEIREVSAKCIQSDDVDTRYLSFYGSDSSLRQSIHKESKVDGGNEAAIFLCQNPKSSPDADSLVVQKEAADKSRATDVSSERTILPTVSPTGHLSIADRNLQEMDDTVHPAESVCKALPIATENAREDLDMDVDMEVDDETPINHGTSEEELSTSYVPSENISKPTLTSEVCLSPALEEGEIAAPPPLDKDWIPPPPPDSEPVPPPPPDSEPVPPPLPDEPHVPAYPPQPTYTETVSLPYGEQYIMSYSVPGYQYYGTTLPEVPSANYYSHNEGSQIAESQQSQYYDAASSAYAEGASVMVSPMEPLVYYNLPNNGAIPSVPVIGSLESSGFYGGSSSVSYHDTVSADETGAPGVPPESTYSSLPILKDEPDGAGVHPKTQMPVVQVPTTVQATATATVQATTTAQATTTIALKVNPPGALATTTSIVAAPSTDADKIRTKAVRSKKRTVAVASTLRSNKKVSSLVDKWKAAKEELHEDEEDEPENAYEMLEKKRHREIEKWRTQQIASGEVKDNANFQPLGGDWRERVKRKRARSTTEVNSSLPDTPMKEKQQPDLTEISRDLPSGWQAYWDESSKEVYYGNVITSQTTWTKPTK